MKRRQYQLLAGLSAYLVLVTLFTVHLVIGDNVTEPPATRVEVYPQSIRLNTAADHQSIVVRLVEADGTTRDLTHEATYTVADPDRIRFEGGRVYPLEDGRTQLIVEAAGSKHAIDVQVSAAREHRPVSFKLDVMPALTKMGCNTGECHGSASGQDGFHLSLFAYDPDRDYFDITRQLAGRRINLAMPEESLLLTKATGEVSHSGGTLTDKESELYQIVLEWIRAGAPKDADDVPRVLGIAIMPQDIVLEGEGSTQQIVVRAMYSDGTDRDVTHLAALMTNNAMSADVDETGRITAGVRGEAQIMARFDAHTIGTQAIVIPDGITDYPTELPANNYIDELVNDKLRKMRIIPSELCSDQDFLRRVYLDIIGMLPTPEEYHRFMNDDDSHKREKLVDELLNRIEFVEIWTMKWAERLQIRSSNQVSYKSMLLYYNWLLERMSNNVPMDQIVRELLASQGGTFTNPATNYYEIERDTLQVAENVAQAFMGFRMQCAQCHNHPFDRWTMDDYYGFAAFFGQIGRKGSEDPRERIIFNRNSGDVRHPVGNRVMEPTFLGGEKADVRGRDRREVLAEWLTAPQNDYFSQNMANFIWEHFFGRGIVDPIDDFRISNPPSNPQLLAALGHRLVAYNYDFRRLVRDICTSRTYQLSTRPNETNMQDESNFSRAAVRRVRAEILLDCISQVTQTPNKFPGLPMGARAVQIADGNTTNYFLTTFGRAPRETTCSCEVVMEPNLSQALHLINGSITSQRIREGKVVESMMQQEKSPQQIIEQLYLICLTRHPNQMEMEQLNMMLEEEENTRQLLEDIFWALLNSKEFLFNH